jgi:rubrerythrin
MAQDNSVGEQWQCSVCYLSWAVALTVVEKNQRLCPNCKTLGKNFSQALHILRRMSYLREIYGNANRAVALLDCLDWRDQLVVWVCPGCRQAYVATLWQRLQGKSCQFCQNQSKRD